MPIYAYKCSSCGHADDVLQKMSAAPLTDCPACGKSTYSKQVTAPQFQLKGSGWYKTDFKDKSAKKDGDKAASKSEGKSEDKSEDKKGHTLDSGPAHTHDSSCGHSHSHGGSTHSHGPGGHKH